jgi:hypothetical protein
MLALSSSFPVTVTSAVAVVRRRIPSHWVTNRFFSSTPSHIPDSKCFLNRPVEYLKRLHRHEVQLPNPNGCRRNFVSSTTPKQERLSLRPVSPREGRYDLITAAAKGRKQGSTTGGGSGRRYPSYVYFTGGVVAASGVGIYMQFQDYAPLTNRRRWIASSPEMEKEMGDQVSYFVFLYPQNVVSVYHDEFGLAFHYCWSAEVDR